MYKGSQKSHNPYNPSRFNGKKKFYHNGKRSKLAEKIEESKFVNSLVTHEPDEVFIPAHQFTDFALSEKLQANIAYQKYNAPTPIQDQAIPAILEGRDVIGIANTGTGKTAAFLLPLIEKIKRNNRERALIVAPTRELALQIKTELQKFAHGLGIHAILCIGGASLGMQKNELRRNPHIVIGTPGRLKDLVEQKAISLQQFGNVVLDEVDRMVDIGFIKDITFLVSHLPKERQSLFFSATITPEVNNILKAFVTDPVTISVKTRETSEHIKQDIIKVKDKTKKMDQLKDLLHTTGFDKVIVFGRTKWGIQKLANYIEKQGFSVAAIHGNKSQGQRQRALEDFRRNKATILFATDVAARGLDIPDVTHVINYDAPASYDDYVHRIGRTGRANNIGVALTFID